MGWALALGAVLAVVAVVFVARPFLREPAPASDRLDELAPEARRHATSGPIPISSRSGSPKLCRKKS